MPPLYITPSVFRYDFERGFSRCLSWRACSFQRLAGLSQPININLLLRRSEATQGTEVLCRCLDHTHAQIRPVFMSFSPLLQGPQCWQAFRQSSWLERMPLISGFRGTSMSSLIIDHTGNSCPCTVNPLRPVFRWGYLSILNQHCRNIL